MGIRYLKKHAALEDTVTVEDAEALSAWLQEQPRPAVQLARCTYLHSAVLQVLLALRPALLSVPQDSALARDLSQALADASAPTS